MLDPQTVTAPVDAPIDPAPPPASTSPRWRGVVETALIAVGLLGQLLVMRHTIGGDGRVRWEELQSLLRHGLTASVDNKYSIIAPIFSLPMYAIGNLAHHTLAFVRTYNWVLWVVAIGTIFLIARQVLDRTVLRHWLLLMITASFAAAQTNDFYGDLFTGMTVGVGLLAVAVGRRRAAGWTSVVIGVVNTPATLGGLVVVALRRTLAERRLRYGLIVLITAVLILAESLIRRGSIFSSGYSDDHGFTTFMPYSGQPGFSYPFTLGLVSLLLSFGRGLFFFAPGLLLPVRSILRRWRQDGGSPFDEAYALWIWFTVGLVLVYAQWWAWYGGVTWGPRFLVVACLPATFAIAVRLKESPGLVGDLLTAFVLGVSAWVGLAGVIFRRSSIAPICTTNHYSLESICHYTPDYSVLWYPVIKHDVLTTGQKLYAFYTLVVLLWLLVPLLRRIVARLWPLTVEYLRPRVALRSWRV